MTWERFAEVYNNTGDYPQLSDVAIALGCSYQTVRNKSTILRRMNERGEGPDLISRRIVKIEDTPEPVKPTPREHARVRAISLKNEIETLLKRSRYPVINPEAVVVESYVSQRYERLSGDYVEREGTPRTWLSDTLKVEPVEDCRGRRFIFTGAQNDAAIHEGFWRNLQAYADHLDADIVVGPWTYETQWWSENNPTSRSYDGELADYLCFGQMAVGDNFVFCGEMNTLPTANRPVSDLTTYSRGRWAVFPHAKLQLKSVASTDPGIQAHQVMTSGAVTKPKVIPRKAGMKSIFHHVIGATLVEFDEEGDIFCRQLNASDDGSFYDLDSFVTNGQIIGGQRIKALSCADIHYRKAEPRNIAATFAHDGVSIVDVLYPEHVLIHDLHDNEGRNHHNQGDNAHSYEMALRKRDSVIEEVAEAADFLAFIKRPGMKIRIVESNHDLALEKYVREGRYRMDGINIRVGLQLEDAYLAWREQVADALEKGEEPTSFSLLEHACRKLRGKLLDGVIWIHDGKSFVIDGVECGHHGFRGANGARGSVVGFAAIGRKMSIGHIHSPEILDGVYVAGVMSLRQGYNKGPSGWAVSHVISICQREAKHYHLAKG